VENAGSGRFSLSQRTFVNAEGGGRREEGGGERGDAPPLAIYLLGLLVGRKKGEKAVVGLQFRSSVQEGRKKKRGEEVRIDFLAIPSLHCICEANHGGKSLKKRGKGREGKGECSRSGHDATIFGTFSFDASGGT